VKLDVSFRSTAQLRVETEEAIRRRERVPMMAESVMLFDKDGELTRLREEVRRVERAAVDPSEWDWLQFLIYHEDDKAHRVGDPAAALVGEQQAAAGRPTGVGPGDGGAGGGRLTPSVAPSRLGETQHRRGEARGLGSLLAGTPEAPERFVVAGAVAAVADHPDGRDALLGVHREDDPLVAVAHDDLAEVDELTAERTSGLLAELFEAHELGQERHQVAAVGVARQIVDRLVDQLDADGHLLVQLAELLPGVAKAMEDVV
jgi:hypothetical protein